VSQRSTACPEKAEDQKRRVLKVAVGHLLCDNICQTIASDIVVNLASR
jgi:hypothetical protein